MQTASSATPGLRGIGHAAIGPRAFTTVEAPVEVEDWMHPFYDAVDPGRWTVFDLRPLRPRIPPPGDLPDGLRTVLYGFDAVVILSGSGPQRESLEPR